MNTLEVQFTSGLRDTLSIDERFFLAADNGVVAVMDEKEAMAVFPIATLVSAVILPDDPEAKDKCDCEALG